MNQDGFVLRDEVPETCFRIKQEGERQWGVAETRLAVSWSWLKLGDTIHSSSLKEIS